MAYIPSTGSVVSFQSIPSSLLSGASIFGQLPAGTAVLGSVATLQGTNPWIVNFANSSIFTKPTGNQSVSGTVDIGINSGSVVAFQAGTRITSVISSTPSSMLVGASIFGMLPSGTQVIGSVATLQGTNPWVTTFNNSSIFATQQGTRITSVVSSTPSSMLTGASIFGMLPSGTQVLGSIAVLQAKNPWDIAGSVIALQPTPLNLKTAIYGFDGASAQIIWADSAGTVRACILGSYNEDSGHTTADPGLFTMGVRNDAVASFVSANLDYTPQAFDAAGRTLIKPFSSEDGTIISYTGSVVSASVTLIQASAIGKKSYITDFLIANTGSVAQLLTFQDGSTSVLGYTIAPAGGGSNATGWNITMKTANAQDLAFKITGTSSIVYVTVKGYQAQ